MEKISLSLRPYQEAPDPRHVDVLDGFRVLFIFLVGWYHIWQQSWISPCFVVSGRVISLDFLLRSGYIWVDGLILLSGFLLYLPFTQGTANPPIWPFYKRRLIRILPSYLLCIIPQFILALFKGSYASAGDAARDLGAHLLFIQNLFPFSFRSSPLNGALWTLAVEMQFYLIFPFLARAYKKKPLLTYALMTGAAFAFRLYASRFQDTSMLVNQLPAFLDVYANGFAAASVFAVLRKKSGKDAADKKIRLLFSVLLVICLGQLIRLAIGQAGENGYDHIRQGQMDRRFPLSVLLSCAMICAAFSLTGIRFLLGNRIMRFLSAVSLQFYIYHQLLAVKLKEWHFPPSISPTPWTEGEYAWQIKFTLCCFVLALGLAALITFLFERPIARRLRKK